MNAPDPNRLRNVAAGVCATCGVAPLVLAIFGMVSFCAALTCLACQIAGAIAIAQLPDHPT